jgi:steroid delta-isomerase-like uncharacterized protein
MRAAFARSYASTFMPRASSGIRTAADTVELRGVGGMSPEELAREWVRGFNEGDFQATTDLTTEDAYCVITAPSAGTSREQAEQDARMWKAAFPDARGEINGMITSGDTAAMELVWVGTQTGDLPNLPATGKAVRINAAVFLTARDGKISRLIHYFDFGGMLMQVGALPGAAA